MKRVLVLTYYFPPAGGSGVQRVLKFVKYLPAFGWRPTVLTVDPARAAYPNLDPTLVEEIPPEVEVMRTASWDPYAAYARLTGRAKGEAVSTGFVKEGELDWKTRLARWLRANVFIPDARVGWVPFAVREASRLLKAENFDLILSTGTPHSTHVAAWWLKQRTGLPWVADFRDPWTDISYYHELPMTAPVRALNAALERAVLRRADAVLSVSDGVGRLLQAKGDLARYETILNGFDPEDVGEEGDAAPDPGLFVLAHVGTLTAQQHAPGLVQALATRYEMSKAWRQRLRVRFVGEVDPAIVAAYEATGLGAAVEQAGYVPHPEAIEAMRRADVLWVAVQRVPRNDGILPAKTFEYLRVGRPILGIAPPDGDLATVLHHTGGGAVFAHDDATSIGSFLDAQFERVQRGQPPHSLADEALRCYDRRELTRRLAGIFDELAGERPGHEPPTTDD